MATTPSLPLNIQEIYDPNFYRANYPELASLGDRELYQHFLTLGITEGRRFSPFFNLNFYRTSNPNIANLNNRALLDHFLNSGLAENRKFSQFIDIEFYRTSNPDLGNLDNVGLFRHLKDSGINEGRDFSQFWDLNFYRLSNPGLAGLNNRQLFDHFQSTGVDQGLKFSPIFDVNYYRNENPDIPGLANLNNRNLFAHFQTTGLAEGRPSSPFFDINFYRANNPGLENLNNRQLLQQFLTVGIFQDRRFSPFFDTSFYPAANPDLAGLDNKQLLEHLQYAGLAEGRYFSPFVDLNFYRSTNPELSNLSNTELFAHFVDTGLAERRPFSPFIDLNYYRSSAGLGELGNEELWEHFQTVGLPQGIPFSRFLDLNYYRGVNPDLNGLNNEQLLEHFQLYGLAEGRRFSPVFDLNVYRNSDPDFTGLTNRQLFEELITSNLSGGGGVGVATNQFFDLDFYRRKYPDLAENGVVTDEDLLEHFQNEGIREGRVASPYFDINYYLENNPDLSATFNFFTNPQEARQKAYEHFQQFGLDEGRPFSRFFDVRYYLDNNHDLRASGLNYRQAFSHFQNAGIEEGRRPSLLFNPVYYIANNPDLLAADLTNREGFEHFQLNGLSEGRLASIWYSPDAIAPVLEANTAIPEGEAPLEAPPTPIPTGRWIELSEKWDNIPAGGTLTYSFVTTPSAFLYGGRESGVAELSPQIKENIRDILRKYDEVLGINLVEVPDRPPNVGQLRFMFSNGPQREPRELGNLGYAYSPVETPGVGLAGDVHLNPNLVSNFEAGAGSYGYQTLLFLVGRALGLKNTSPREEEPPLAEPILPLGRDNNTNTVMSFNSAGAFASTPMSYDVRALQYYYGGGYFNNTDTIHRIDGSNILEKRTVWDSGGVDIIDASGLVALPPEIRNRNFDYYFDMNEGGQNTSQIALNSAIYSVPNPNSTEQNLLPPLLFRTVNSGTTIAFGTEIENLVGSVGNDEIFGNVFANNITGNPGNDKITGGGGTDRLTGGPGNDFFVLARGDGGPTPLAADVITDFQDGQDMIGLAPGLSFQALAIAQGTDANANDTLIRVANTGEYLAVLTGVPSAAITQADFIGADFIIPAA